MKPLLHSKILDGQGPDLLILHGFLGMSDNWKTLGRKWADSGYRVHLIDQRNHGRSFWSNEFSYALMAADLQAYIEEHQLENYSIIGHSMGGKTLMYWVCAHSSSVDKCVVADIAPRAYPPHHQDILATLAALDFNILENRQAVEEQLRLRITDPGIRMFLMKNIHRKEDKRLGLRLNIDVLCQASSWVSEALPETFRSDTPILFLGGEQSNYILPSDHSQIHQHFSQAIIKYIPNASHWLHAEQPHLFFDRVNQFFQQ